MFNPSEHMMQLSGKDYLEVKWRMVWFREQCPQGTIDTEELAVDLDRETQEEVMVWNPETRKKEKVMKRARGYARYRAIVTDGKGGRATATKSEKAASFPDFCEKAETGAVGRALAMLGYGTQFTGDELAEGDRIVDSPVASPKIVPITDQQVTSLRKLCEHLGHELQDEEIAHMTYQQAKARIEELNTESRDARDRHEQERARKPAQPLHNGDESPVTILRVKDVYGRGVERGAWTEKDFYATISAALNKAVSRENAHQLTQKELAVLNTLPPVTAAVY